MDILDIVKDFDGSVAAVVIVLMWRHVKQLHESCEKDRRELWKHIESLSEVK